MTALPEINTISEAKGQILFLDARKWNPRSEVGKIHSILGDVAVTSYHTEWNAAL